MLRLEVRKSALAFALISLCAACAGNAPTADATVMQSVATPAAGGGAVERASSGGAGAPSAGAAGARSVSTSAGSPNTGASAGTVSAVMSSNSVSAAGSGVAGAGAATVAGSAGAAGAAMMGAAGAAAEEPAEVDPKAPLTAVAFFPSKDRTNACADASVSIQFNRTPILKAGGKIQILDESGAVFDSVTSSPNGDLYFSGLVTRSSGGQSFKSEVLDIVFNTVVFHPKGKLALGKKYFVTVDEGMITDDLGTKFSVKQADNWTFTVRAQAPAASSMITLAADGGGDFCSLEGVLEALPNSAGSKRMVQVGPGVYPGIVRMPDSQVHFVGSGIDKSVFAHKNCATMNSNSREGIVVSGSDVTFENLTIFNTYLKDSNGQQAEALYVDEGSSKVFLKNVHLRSHQDTLRVDGSAYMEGGKISGSTDPLWGYGAFYCDGCELSSRTSGHAFVVTRSTKGFGLVNCSVTKESSSVSSTYLAQYHDGSEPGKIAFVKCKIGSHVAGWKRAQGNAWYEYQNTKLESGDPVMFDGRQLTAGSPELEAASSVKSWLGWAP
jgi:pectin methylesterase-like acyl-CoA thioesterase